MKINIRELEGKLGELRQLREELKESKNLEKWIKRGIIILLQISAPAPPECNVVPTLQKSLLENRLGDCILEGIKKTVYERRESLLRKIEKLELKL